jgi:hypothetical protein
MYVGETKRQLKQRFLEHRRNIINKKYTSHLITHFNQENHSLDKMRVQILTQLPQMSTTTNPRLNTELEWIRLLGTAYPFGLNEHIKGYGNATKTSDTNKIKLQPYLYYRFARKEFKSHTDNRTKHALRSTLRCANHTNNIQHTLSTICDQSELNNTFNVFKILRDQSEKQLSMLMLANSRSKSKERGSELLKSYMLGHNFKHFNNSDIIKKPHIDIVIPFINKKQDLLNMSAIFNNCALKNKLKLALVNQNIPHTRIIHKYNVPISRQIFNYNPHLKRLTEKKLINNITKPCTCHKSPELIYKPTNHIVTGDSLACGPELKSIFSKGTKHKINEELTQSILDLMFDEAIESYITKLKRLHKVTYDDLNSIKETLRENYERYLKSFLNKIGSLSETDPPLDKSKIHEFIITPIDKASNNYSFCCTKYYDLIMMQELGVIHTNNMIIHEGNETYRPIQSSEESIVNRHTEKMKQWKLKQSDENKTLPIIYAIPKMHKNPYKYRFISGARKASSKQLSVLLLNALKLIKSHFHNYCGIIKERTGKTVCWSIDNNKPVLEFINRQKTINSLISYDFSTLFTKLPHDIIINNMSEMIGKMFKHSKKSFMHIPVSNTYGQAYYSDQEKCKSTYVTFQCIDLLDILDFIVRESYVKFAGHVYHQLKGIPMGGNASSLIADLTLSMLEFRFLSAQKHQPKNTATFRYVDDLSLFNGTLAPNIYPPELVLTQETPDPEGNLNYLDLTISIPLISTKLYNKTDHFKFSVIKSMHVTSAVSCKTTKGIIISQLLRYSTANTTLKDFNINIRSLISNYITNDHEKQMLYNAIRDFIAKYPHYLHKYELFSKKKAVCCILSFMQ